MADNTKIQVVFATILAETSPQALPLGTACVVSSVRNAKLKNIKTSLCDISYDEVKELGKDAPEFLAGQILDAVERSGCGILVVSFSAFVWNVADCVRTAEIVKAKAKVPAVFVCGGPEITARARVSAFSQNKAGAHSRQFDDLGVFDYLIQGEGETVFIELLKKIESGVPGAGADTAKAAKKHPKLIVGTTEDCAKLSSPWLDGTIDPVTYNGVLWELSRGCPYACSYCFESKGERRVRKFPIERLEKEIELFARKKVPQIFVLDPTFNADRERALKLLKLMAKNLHSARTSN